MTDTSQLTAPQLTEIQHTQALLDAGDLQAAIFNSAMFSKIATDAHGVIQIFNVGAEHMLGYAAADVTDRIALAQICDPLDLRARADALSAEFAVTIQPDFEALVFRAARGIEDIYELAYLHRDGSRLPAVVSVTSLRNADDLVIGYLLVGIDNTARKRADQALQDTAMALENAKLAAEKANLAKSDFLSSMSHELRSPLNAILGFAQLMESGAPPPTPSQKDSIEQILQAGWYLLELINEILDLSLIESGKLSLSPESMSLAEVLHDCRAMIDPQARKSGIQMHFPDFTNPWFVNADRTRVKQVVVNLLSNAIKYNRVGGRVDVSCGASAEGRVRISFQDTGEGLSPVKLAQLFQPFNRLGQEAGVEEGTGIGLVVSKRLIELMGGAIGAESSVGVGSLFWIELDATSAPQWHADAPASTTTATVAALADEHSSGVLCVEDNPANLLLIERLIERRPDIRLISARDGKRGVEMARSARPDVILMDINLPGISGFAALRILSGDPATAAIPVIALSANAMPRDIAKGLEAGFFRYLTKPIKVAEFMASLDEALEVSRAAPVGEGRP